MTRRAADATVRSKISSILAVMALALATEVAAQDIPPAASNPAPVEMGPPLPPPTAEAPDSPQATLPEDDSAPSSGDASGAGDESQVMPEPKKKIGPGAPSTKKKSTSSKKKPAPVVKKGIVLSPITPLAPSVDVRDRIVDECRLRTAIPRAIADRSREVHLSDGLGTMKLELKIVDVHAPGGGFFTGPKWITLEGRLYAGKTLKGTFTAKESSMSSMSACGMLKKVIDELATDVVVWLRKPTKGALLGSAR